ncbi:hypothetical protein [Burkholderia cepacia]|uniref:hypothetical protein n=1 Tax=Burkholderia cepacia TaxID=292 RepID=UPI000F5A7C50|nr:hypothetical protein [Burkholderia cepacia]
MTTAPAALPPYRAQHGPAHARRNRVPFPRVPRRQRPFDEHRPPGKPRRQRATHTSHADGAASHRHIAKTMTRLCSPAARFIARLAIAVDGGFIV